MKIKKLLVLVLFFAACTSNVEYSEPVLTETGLFGMPSAEPVDMANFDLNLVKMSDVPEIKLAMNRYLTREKSSIRDGLSKRQNFGYLDGIFNSHGLPSWITSVAMIESGYRPDAKSHAGATGVWQFTKGTAKAYGLQVNAGNDQRRDPLLSSKAAAKHLSDLYTQFDDWTLALAAYNAGPGAVSSAIKKSGSRNFWYLARKGYFRTETINFVPKVLAAAIITQDPSSFGF